MKLFRRFRSTLHGNYRRAYLLTGLAAGVTMGVFVLLRWLMQMPIEVPAPYAVEGIMALFVVGGGVIYRRGLPDKLATFKEMMLFGMGTAAMAAIVYGICLWLLGLIAPAQVEIITHTYIDQPIVSPLSYWAAWWGIWACIETLVVGGLVAFLSALFLGNEKAPTVNKKSSN